MENPINKKHNQTSKIKIKLKQQNSRSNKMRNEPVEREN